MFEKHIQIIQISKKFLDLVVVFTTPTTALFIAEHFLGLDPGIIFCLFSVAKKNQVSLFNHVHSE